MFFNNKNNCQSNCNCWQNIQGSFDQMNGERFEFDDCWDNFDQRNYNQNSWDERYGNMDNSRERKEERKNCDCWDNKQSNCWDNNRCHCGNNRPCWDNHDKCHDKCWKNVNRPCRPIVWENPNYNCRPNCSDNHNCSCRPNCNHQNNCCFNRCSLCLLLGCCLGKNCKR